MKVLFVLFMGGVLDIAVIQVLTVKGQWEHPPDSFASTSPKGRVVRLFSGRQLSVNSF